MGKQIFRWCRFVAKCVSLPFLLAGVYLFIFQFLPTYAKMKVGQEPSLAIFVVGSLMWGLDTLWSTKKDAKEILDDIKKGRQVKKINLEL